MATPTTKTFITYEEQDLHVTFTHVREVASRDIGQPGFADLFKDGFGYTLFPAEFHFFDADVTAVNGKEIIGKERNRSKTYVLADSVMTLDDFKKEQLPKIAVMKKDKGNLLTRIFNANRPVMAWYIDGVEQTLKAAAAERSTVIAETCKGSYYTAVTDDMIILDRDLKPLYPAVQTQPAAPAPAPKM